MKAFVLVLAVTAIALLGATVAYALPGKPSFEPGVHADGVAWGTKATAPLPAPMGNNRHSYDNLLVVLGGNNPGMQLPVGEAAPGNPAYNGGRWIVYTATWNAAGIAHHGIVPILESMPELRFHEALGHIDVVLGPPAGPGAPPPYFQCPLLPVK